MYRTIILLFSILSVNAFAIAPGLNPKYVNIGLRSMTKEQHRVIVSLKSKDGKFNSTLVNALVSTSKNEADLLKDFLDLQIYQAVKFDRKVTMFPTTYNALLSKDLNCKSSKCITKVRSLATFFNVEAAPNGYRRNYGIIPVKPEQLDFKAHANGLEIIIDSKKKLKIRMDKTSAIVARDQLSSIVTDIKTAKEMVEINFYRFNFNNPLSSTLAMFGRITSKKWYKKN